MSGDVGGPVARRTDQDVVGEAVQRGTDVVEAADDPQVLVLRGEPLGETASPAVDQREREDPGERGGVAAEKQRPPAQPDGEYGAVRDDGRGHDGRGRRAGADVRVPGREQRWPVDVQGVVGVLDGAADDRGGGDQDDARAGGCQVAAVSGALYGRRLGDVLGAVLGLHAGTVRTVWPP